MAKIIDQSAITSAIGYWLFASVASAGYRLLVIRVAERNAGYSRQRS
jgi:hypothetical protein